MTVHALPVQTGLTALHYVATAGDVESVKLLIAMKSSLDARDAMGCTPLHYSVDRGRESATDLLVFCGADAISKNKVCLRLKFYLLVLSCESIHNIGLHTTNKELLVFDQVIICSSRWNTNPDLFVQRKQSPCSIAKTKAMEKVLEEAEFVSEGIRNGYGC